MLVRDIDGRLVIISRSNCKNEKIYNEKLYNIRLAFSKKYKSVFINPPKDVIKNKVINLKDTSDD
jgi:hypothetical protein